MSKNINIQDQIKEPVNKWGRIRLLWISVQFARQPSGPSGHMLYNMQIISYQQSKSKLDTFQSVSILPSIYSTPQRNNLLIAIGPFGTSFLYWFPFPGNPFTFSAEIHFVLGFSIYQKDSFNFYLFLESRLRNHILGHNIIILKGHGFSILIRINWVRNQDKTSVLNIE